MIKNSILKITQTALLLAILLIIHVITRPYSQLITGSLVNLVLLLGVFLVGRSWGLILAFISPLVAFLLGFGPIFIQIVIFVAIANAVYVSLAWWLLHSRIIKSEEFLLNMSGLILAGLVKTLLLALGLVVLILPLIPGLSEAQRVIISASFTWPQLITSLIGGFLALFIVPILSRHNNSRVV